MARRRVKKAFSRLPDRALNRAADVMKVLGHPARLKLLDLLSDADHTVGDLAERMAMPQPTVSAHLIHMTDHGLLSRHRRGRTVSYRVISPEAAVLLEAIHRQALADLSFQGGEAI
ncbi:MAG: hypothetical protein CMJ49_08145 [Planctomycetaceae bacterium]|nr:hypothetical protein [Planctomycetaceae bacterium]